MSFIYYFCKNLQGHYLRLLFYAIAVTARESKTDLILLTDTNSSGTEYWCITNGTEPVTWLDLNNNIENGDAQTTVFYTKTNVDFDDAIENSSKHLNYWTTGGFELQQNWYYEMGLVLDQRWESEQLSFIYAGTTDKNRNFEIPFSVRAEKDAFLFLCTLENQKPPDNDCYWILLGSNNNNKTAIRKCFEEKIPQKLKAYPQNQCKVMHDEYEYSKTSPSPLNKTQWAHFILRRTNSTITLIHEQKQVLRYTDEDLSIEKDGMHLYLGSRDNKVYWKIHTCTTEKNFALVGEPFKVTRDGSIICVSMYVFICEYCILSIILLEDGSEVARHDYTWKENKWQEIMFTANRTSYKDKHYQLSVNTTSPGKKGFWAIDSVRQCYEKDFRISVTKRVKSSQMQCQLLSGSMAVNEKTTRNNNEFLCESETEIGSSCFNCSILSVTNACLAKRACEINNDGDINCFCTSGYKGEDCKRKCKSGFYGRNCAKTCGHCYDEEPCNHVTGQCLYCANNYNLPLCQDTILPVAAEAPKIIITTPTTATIDIKNLNSTPSVNKPEFFTIEYKEHKSATWHQFEQKLPFRSRDTTITITGLKKSTQYSIRYVLWDNNNDKYDANVPQVSFNTTCIDVHADDIEIKTANTSAVVNIHVRNETCEVKEYEYAVERAVKLSRLSNSNTILYNLEPYQNYIFTLYRKDTRVTVKQFTTQEGVPSEVRELKYVKVTNSTASLRWKEPQYLRGKLQHYIVEYKHQRHLACNQNSESDSKKEIATNPSYILTELIPYSSYQVNVYAKTAYYGNPIALILQTTQNDIVSNEEVPQGKPKITISATYVTVNFKRIECSRFKGPIHLDVSYLCVDSWCDINRTITAFYSFDYLFHLSGLIPYSNYTVDIQVGRNDSTRNGIAMSAFFFRTSAAAPGVVRNLTVYSKDETSASLRWLPPYPPCGNIKEIRVIVTYEWFYPTYKASDKRYGLVHCDLWPEFYCITLKGLDENKSYTFEIYAYNEGVEKYGRSVWHSIYTQQESSEPPGNFTVLRDELNSSLFLQWEHPEISNGPIVHFKIEIFCSQNKILMDQLNVTEITLHYRKTVTPKTIPFCKTCEIRLTAVNKWLGHPSTRNINFPPQIPYFTTPPKTESSSNTTVTINVPRINGKQYNNKGCVFISMDGYTKEYKTNTCSNWCGDVLKDTIFLQEKNVLFLANFSSFQRESHISLGNQRFSTATKECETKDLVVTLLPSTCYNISFILMSQCSSRNNPLRRFNSYGIRACLMGNDEALPLSTSASAAWYFLFLLIAPVAILLLTYYYKQHAFLLCREAVVDVLNTRNGNQNANPDLIPLSTPSAARSSQGETRKVSTAYSKSVTIMDFEKYVMESIENGELEKQHQIIANLPLKSCEYGIQKPNKTKNRYANLVAYDHSRVVLDKIGNDAFSDYINANFIHGYNSNKAYIATQGPKANTLYDFWRMVWQENVKHIIMVANIYEGKKKKVEKYWPDINQTNTYEDIIVECLTVNTHAEYEHRNFTVTRGGQKRTIQQLHFTSWPDHGVPLYSQSLVPFLKEILTIPVGRTPIVVHCSAGVGRTGTIILCDVCLRMAAAENRIDVLNHLYRLRQNRACMVDNPEQYKLVHLVLLDILFAPQTNFICDDKMETVVRKFTQKSTLRAQMDYLDRTQWYDSAAKSVARQNNPSHENFPEKNRFSHIVPDELHMVHLTPFPPFDYNPSYINAVIVKGFKDLNKYVATQQPLPNTVADFWRMVVQIEANTIVSLNEVSLKDTSSVQFWPDKSAASLDLPFVSVVFLDTVEFETHHVVILELIINKIESEEKRKVHMVRMKDWFPDEQLPPNLESLLTIWQEMDVLSRGSEYTVISCYDGATASGLLITLSFIIERIKLEQVCDVCLAVRSIRRSRKQFVKTEEQFQFLYNAALLYVKGFQTYSNFCLK